MCYEHVRVKISAIPRSHSQENNSDMATPKHNMVGSKRMLKLSMTSVQPKTVQLRMYKLIEKKI